MKKIKIKFVDGYQPDLSKNLVYLLLTEKYDVELSDTPEYLFSMCLGEEHRKYHCIKIAQIGENIVPDFNSFDYAAGFDYMTFGDRYLRIPLYCFYLNEYQKCLERKNDFDDEKLLARGFCSFVVTNSGGNPLRKKFFERLSKYKPVASGGRYLNNVGMPDGVPDKKEFCSKYKFNIAFENCASPGYTTEKILEPLAWHCVPIYWGNPLIESEINKNCFIHLKDENDVDNVIEQIVALDKNDDAYLQKIKEAPFVSSLQLCYHQQLMNFLQHIIEQPQEQARRLNCYGYQNLRRKIYADTFYIAEKYKSIFKVLRKGHHLKQRLFNSNSCTENK